MWGTPGFCYWPTFFFCYIPPLEQIFIKLYNYYHFYAEEIQLLIQKNKKI